jgi:hypothetical protein
MPPKDFKPPRHVETHSYIFDRQTGEILATETRWTDEGAEPGVVSRDLLHSIAADSGRTPKDLDVLVAKARVTQGAQRIDVKTRKVVSAKIDKQADTQVPNTIRRA